MTRFARFLTGHRRVTRLRRLARPLLVCALLAVASGCRRVADPDPLVGTFIATTLVIEPSGRPPTNVLAFGGILGLNVANNYVVRGTLIIPPVVDGGATADLSGSATRTDETVVFLQANPTFLAALTFTLVGDRLEARRQTVNGTTYDVVLTRQ